MAKRKSKKRVKQSSHELEAKGLPSASGFDAEFRCLGKRALCSQLPAEEDTAVTNRGTRIHTALETSDLSKLSMSEQITASRCMYAEAELVHDFDFEGSETIYQPPRFWDVDDDLEQTWSARLDTLFIQRDRRRLMLDDHKTGWSVPVPIAQNWQIKAQAALAADLHDADEVVAALVHPHHPDSLYEVVTYDRATLEANLETVRQKVVQIQSPDQSRTPNPISCQFCTAKGICPEYQAQMSKLAEAIADEVEDKGFTAILRRTPQERGEHFKRIEMVADNVKELKAKYVTFVEQDQSAGRLEDKDYESHLVTGFGLRFKWDTKIKDEDEAIVLTERAFGSEALNAALKFNRTALEEHLSAKMSKKEAKERVSEVLRGVMQFQKSKGWLEERRAL
jgi:hypothetical protein